jgi:hypothetical protein
VIVITDNTTFSAAIITTALVKHFAGERAVIVGERPRDRLVFWAEGGQMQLPNSKIEIPVSTGTARLGTRLPRSRALLLAQHLVRRDRCRQRRARRSGRLAVFRLSPRDRHRARARPGHKMKNTLSILLFALAAGSCATMSAPPSPADVSRAAATISADDLVARIKILSPMTSRAAHPARARGHSPSTYLVREFKALGLSPGIRTEATMQKVPLSEFIAKPTASCAG